MLSNKTQIMLDKLLATYLSKGVQPSDIADTMFEEHYIDLDIKKTSTSLVMTYSFEEPDDEDQLTLITMKYTYNKSMYLQEISQKVGKGRYKVQWDRSDDLRTIVNEIILATSSDSQLEQVVQSLPNEVKGLLKQPIAA
ncbi:hypothetical protein OPW32_07300 [Vibrio europaeus]|uniref:hypothetical protein n=1 Tax=Vibrio europaeus TaxID=300876 RepID=UPI002340184B|nr:hypothetical protein [Vibrio europaeus]MDC5849021.1 hypothetical protein [Vibrio europaeus]